MTLKTLGFHAFYTLPKYGAVIARQSIEVAPNSFKLSSFKGTTACIR